jgi:hypothetical protein
VITPDSSDPAAGQVCGTCGTVSDSAQPVTWSVSVPPDGGRVWTCERCARDHLRSIEAKLDDVWW